MTELKNEVSWSKNQGGVLGNGEDSGQGEEEKKEGELNEIIVGQVRGYHYGVYYGWLCFFSNQRPRDAKV